MVVMVERAVMLFSGQYHKNAPFMISGIKDFLKLKTAGAGKGIREPEKKGKTL